MDGGKIRWHSRALPALLAAAAVLIAAAVWNSARVRTATAIVPTGVEGTRPGDTAPDFRVVDITGRVVTRAALLAGGKPGLLFFTATWCLPCVEGLRQLRRFQQEVGEDLFRVLVVFVDPRETEADLRAYRDRYGFPRSWFYAPDRDRMVLKYRVRFLDTKFLLDPQGVIRWTDVYPATDETWRRALGAVGIRR
ncbi:MAG: TlpA disulfide reductase family protein [Armatimonadota bacterium]|nr:TlpA disulfide reductase family protein [Armatimonadota bacterium]MDR7440488.1 TlpA disulfide reductase family protein [Armatimonadota bacterium]MDR7443980.1 TlpA disulfide reductase family protein [Armatimonadota bacterium]MDR7570078.1 TlpA disulfide reductase family protein [Armatimonadota bacterium]MDR7615417.1 TlpA disulfide reductase family protein [Armatimonadota bacterium]